MLYNFWDTTGLDEGSEGTVPAEEAENKLKELMRDLAHSGGINLIIYCIRCTRLTRALRRNYDLFYVALCQERVPVALVVTGLEHQQGEMETWWVQNEAALRRHEMRFNAHACVTTVNTQDPVIQQRRSESRARLCDLVRQHSMFPGWKADSSFLSRVKPLFNLPVARYNPGHPTAIRKVAVCGSLPGCVPGTDAVWDKSTSWRGNTQYQFIRADKPALDTVAPRMLKDIRGVDLLVFYASALVDNRIQSTDVVKLKNVYNAAYGERCPMIVVLRDCDPEEVGSAHYAQIASHRDEVQVHFISIPSTNAGGTKLIDEIEKCMEHEGRRKNPSRHTMTDFLYSGCW